jgi:lipopolysaccharide/colanic/teichoic acid biosynthesis glycosyltransferase
MATERIDQSAAADQGNLQALHPASGWSVDSALRLIESETGRADRPGRELTARLDLAAKRLLDIAGAAILLVLLAPVLGALAVLVRLDSPGPALFRQERVGLRGRPFTMLKFRSMWANADQKIHAAYVQERMRAGLTLVNLPHDRRITRIGRVLRATSLDELPQLWNVLRGDMSLVGPRPALSYEVDLSDAAQRLRLRVRPGLTGLAQLYSRGTGTMEENLTYDLEYVARRSLWLDLSILVRTVPAVLQRRGAS